jgi:hypothetical protein
MEPRNQKAQKVLEVFPSFHDLMNNLTEYRIDRILLVKEHKMYKKSLEWKGVALAADKISCAMNGHTFWDKYDFDEAGKGSAIVLDNKNEPHEVDFCTFCALIVLFYITSINMKLNQDQYHAWDNFIDDEEIRKILY